MREVNRIIIHCSASDHEHHDNIETIRNWHIDENGWSDIGYHLVITKDGKPHIGRPIHKKGAHCLGWNDDSIGICLTGEFDFSNEQKETLKEVIRDYQLHFSISDENVRPHNHFNIDKTCPNFDVKDVLKLKQDVSET